MDYQKIYEALKTIKEVCTSNNGDNCCERCPLGKTNGFCCVRDKIPEKWKIKSPDSIIKLME